MVRKILSIVLWVATAAGLIVLFIFSRENYLTTPVQSVNLEIERANDSGFIKEKTVLSSIDHFCSKANIGTLNLVAISKQLSGNPWIESSSSYVDLDGNLNVSIKEHTPVMRVFGKDGQSIYVTDNGILLPSSKEYTPYVLVASGNFDFGNLVASRQLCDSIETDHNLINALHLFKAVEKNSFMKNSVGQIYCDNKNSFNIVIRDIDAKVVVGDTCDMDDKLKRAEIFIKQKANTNEIKEMKIINLQYKNQIVCTKR